MRLRFTTRDLLWLCLVLALLIGWAVQPPKERTELRTALELAHGDNDKLVHENKALRAVINAPLQEQEKKDLGTLMLKSSDAEIVEFLNRYEAVLRQKNSLQLLAPVTATSR